LYSAKEMNGMTSQYHSQHLLTESNSYSAA